MSNTDTPAILIVIHGHGFKAEEKSYRQSLERALRSRLKRDHPTTLAAYDDLDKTFVYFGDLTNRLLESRGQTYDSVRDTADRQRALKELEAYAKPKLFSLSRYDRLPGKSALKEFLADVGSPLLQSVGLSQKAMARIAPDLMEYWDQHSQYRRQVQERIQTPIQNALDEQRDLMLIAHGIGSIYAYDALHKLSRERESDATSKCQFLTLGSPLGDGMVQSQLAGHTAEPEARYPRNIRDWHNLAAEDDYFCHDKTLQDDFYPMLEQGLVQQIKDHRIYNLAVRYGKSQPQSLLGYLAHPRTAQLINHWLIGRGAGKFSEE